MNDIIRNLTIENFLNLKSAFDNSKKIFWDDKKSKLIHPGEYGSYREQIIAKWLRMYTPERYGIANGFIIDSTGSISTQCDLIIYDKFTTPKIENLDNQRFFPVECVLAVCEIKSTIKSISDLNMILIKLAQIKKLRFNVIDPIASIRHLKSPIPPTPKLISHDNIFTILICNNFGFELLPQFIDYKKEHFNIKHNLILSLTDGLLTYEQLRENGQKALLPIPFQYDKFFNYHLIKSDQGDLPMHIKHFLSQYSTGISLTTTLSIDMVHYFLNDIEILNSTSIV